MQIVKVTIRWSGETGYFGPFETDGDALNFIKKAKANKDVLEALRSDIASPDSLSDFLPTED